MKGHIIALTLWTVAAIAVVAWGVGVKRRYQPPPKQVFAHPTMRPEHVPCLWDNCIARRLIDRIPEWSI